MLGESFQRNSFLPSVSSRLSRDPDLTRFRRPVGWGLLLGDNLPSVSSRLSRDPDLTRFHRPVGWGLLLGDDSRGVGAVTRG